MKQLKFSKKKKENESGLNKKKVDQSVGLPDINEVQQNILLVNT